MYAIRSYYALAGALPARLPGGTDGAAMTIWVDADACPRPIKEILFRAAERTGVMLTLVANHAMASYNFV